MAAELCYRVCGRLVPVNDGSWQRRIGLFVIVHPQSGWQIQETPLNNGEYMMKNLIAHRPKMSSATIYSDAISRPDIRKSVRFGENVNIPSHFKGDTDKTVAELDEAVKSSGGVMPSNKVPPITHPKDSIELVGDDFYIEVEAQE